MATFRNDGKVSNFRARFISGMLTNGYERGFAERCFSQIEGFGTCGFPESHAASFAILVYASSWVKCHHPEVFLAAILNAQPLGFYAPAQLVGCARNHGVVVLPVDINTSRWDCTLEKQGGEKQADASFAVRLGLRQIKGFAVEDAAEIVAARHAPYQNLEDLARRTGLSARALGLLAEADTCGSVAIDRRQALWTVRALRTPLPLFASVESREPAVALTALTAGENVLQDFSTTSLSLRAHPVSFLRAKLEQEKWRPLGDLAHVKDGSRIRIAGLVLVRQRPGSANGIVFVTLEDETGVGNLVVWPQVFEANRAVVMTARLLACEGRVQREGDIVHIVARALVDLTPWLRQIGDNDLESNAEPRLRVTSKDFH